MNFKNKKILHFGNIANNAYLNSKFLRKKGYLSDVISINYKHIMGQPEWEDGEVLNYQDDFNPNFIISNKFQKPSWFYDGKIDEILNKFKNKKKILTSFSIKNFFIDKFFKHYKTFLLFFLIFKTIYFFFTLNCPKTFKNFLNLHKYHFDSMLLKIVFEYYDNVIFYGGSSLYGYLSNIPYYCYEHGTIRDFPYQNNLFGRLVYQSYKNCKHLFITNCDAIKDARKIGIENFSFMPHPINEDIPTQIEKKNMNAILEILKNKSCITIFHPPRQHWSKEKRNPNLDKGNDIFWDALKKLLDEGVDFYCIAIQWGDSMVQTNNLIDKHGIREKVKFIKPLCHYDFIRVLNCVDCVADQFFLGAFGSLAPKALMHNKPVLINYNYNFHDWVFDNHPPFINCKNSFDIYQNILNFDKNAKFNSVDWYQKNHSSDVIINKFKKVLNL